MKTIRLLARLLTVASMLTLNQRVNAQPGPGQPPPPGAGGVTVGDEQMRRNLEQAKRDIEQSRREMEQAQRMVLAQSGGRGGSGGVSMDTLSDAQKQAFDSSLDRLKKLTFQLNGGPEQPLVIASSEMTPPVLAEFKEDLNVMARLVRDAVAGDRGSQATRRAMGIPVIMNWNSFADAHTTRPLYVDGYGAIFETSVPFPLTAASGEKTDTQSKSNESSAWDAARRELYGHPGDDADLVTDDDAHNTYSPELVEALKRSILKALANAGNFRHLKQNEKITVAVVSREAKMWPRSLSGFPGQQPDSSAKSPGATLTISIKKSDADDLASGKINESDFRKRAAIVLY